MRQTKTKFDPTKTFFTGYGVDIVRRLYNSIKDAEKKKLISRSVEFSDDLANNIDDNGKTNGIFRFLKENKIIKDYTVDVYNDMTFDPEGFEEGPAYYIEYKCDLVPEKVIEYAMELSIIPRYVLRIGGKKERYAILLNDRYVLSCPNYDSPSRNLFEIVYKNPREKLTKSFIEKEITKGRKEEFNFNRKLSGILADLGFTKEIKSIFFPLTSEQALYFRNDVYESELSKDYLNNRVLKAQFSKLKSHRNNKK